MKTKAVAFGERQEGRVLAYEETRVNNVLTFGGDDGEGYILVSAGNIRPKPKPDDRGIIQFERGGPMGGHWQYKGAI